MRDRVAGSYTRLLRGATTVLFTLVAASYLSTLFWESLEGSARDGVELGAGLSLPLAFLGLALRSIGKLRIACSLAGAGATTSFVGAMTYQWVAWTAGLLLFFAANAWLAALHWRNRSLWVASSFAFASAVPLMALTLLIPGISYSAFLMTLELASLVPITLGAVFAAVALLNEKALHPAARAPSA